MNTLQQPAPETQLTRWSLKVSAEADVDLRMYLAQHGMRKGDLSKFVEQAVRRDLL
ncbi:MAG: ribbon-helix-helix domain-containing protein, partial [Casimicrobium sp.]